MVAHTPTPTPSTTPDVLLTYLPYTRASTVVKYIARQQAFSSPQCAPPPPPHAIYIYIYKAYKAVSSGELSLPDASRRTLGLSRHARPTRAITRSLYYHTLLTPLGHKVGHFALTLRCKLKSRPGLALGPLGAPEYEYRVNSRSRVPLPTFLCRSDHPEWLSLAEVHGCLVVDSPNP